MTFEFCFAGKRTPSSTPSSSDSPEVVRDTPTNSTYTASPSLSSSGLTNHLPMDEGVSPHVGPGGHDPVWTRGSSMKDSVNITPYVTTQPAAKGSAEARGSGGEVVMVDAVLQTPASNKAQVSSRCTQLIQDICQSGGGGGVAGLLTKAVYFSLWGILWNLHSLGGLELTGSFPCAPPPPSLNETFSHVHYTGGHCNDLCMNPLLLTSYRVDS